MQDTKVQNYFYTAILIIVLSLCVVIFLPYLTTFIVAGAFAVLFRPVYLWIFKVTKNRASLSALLTMLIVLILIILPITFLGAQMTKEAIAVYDTVLDGQELGEFISQTAFYFEEKFNISLSDQFTDVQQLQKYAQPVLGWIVSHSRSLVTGIAGFMLRLVIGLMAFYFILRDGGKLRKKLMSLSPLADKEDSHIFGTMKSAINSVLRGALILAVLQGTIAGIGYAIFQVPNPVLWGGLTAVCALIPGLGTALAMIPIIGYQLIANSMPNAIGLAIWGIIAVGLVDNVLGPHLWGKDIKVHRLLILVSVLGGIQFFGPIGIIVGPLCISLLFALIELLPALIEQKRSSS